MASMYTSKCICSVDHWLYKTKARQGSTVCLHFLTINHTEMGLESRELDGCEDREPKTSAFREGGYSLYPTKV